MSELTARRSRENGWAALASASQSMRLSRIHSEAQITVYLQPRQCGLCTSTQIQTLRRTCCISENKLSECSLRARAGYEWLYLDNNVFGYGYLNQTLMYRNSLCIESGDLTCHKLEDPSTPLVGIGILAEPAAARARLPAFCWRGKTMKQCEA